MTNETKRVPSVIKILLFSQFEVWELEKNQPLQWLLPPSMLYKREEGTKWAKGLKGKKLPK